MLVAQQVLSVDLDKIKSITSDITSENYYPTLLSRFNNFDTTLTAKQMHLLYYGKYFQSFYEPSSLYEEREQMFELIKQKDLSSALIHGKLAFEADPLDLKTLFGLYLCHQHLLNLREAENYQFLYYALVGTILKTGSGKNSSEAFVIMNISDEYEIISSLGKEIRKHKNIDGETDCFKLKKGDDKVLNSIKKLYFNIAIPLMKVE
ncbi:hypothetical protein CRYO30217_00797 [Parvicella tangerina]|uniref:Uncharacterized protein n=2 Tax=Parvicella tangerina TaxID=2829795 RepID=A0A916JL91_9FLAO|nr:hypothetical protein CRYO30217_00797 [Parvicella tangerina]